MQNKEQTNNAQAVAQSDNEFNNLE